MIQSPRRTKNSMNGGERARHRTETGTFGGNKFLSRYKNAVLRPILQGQRKLSSVVLGLLVHGPLAQCLVCIHAYQVVGRSGCPMAVEPWVAKKVVFSPYKSTAEGNGASVLWYRRLPLMACCGCSRATISWCRGRPRQETARVNQ